MSRLTTFAKFDPIGMAALKRRRDPGVSLSEIDKAVVVVRVAW